MTGPTSWLARLGGRDVGFLFVGQLVSQIGDSVYLIGLVWLVLELTGSAAATGLVATLAYLPALLFGWLGGVLADSIDRRRLMMATDLGRAAAVAVLALLVASGRAEVAPVAVLAFVVATLGTVFLPARDALLPELTEAGRLVGANTLVQVSGYAAVLLGPLLAALLLASVGLAHLFTVDALTFLVSLVAIWLIRPRPRAVDRPVGEQAARASWLARLAEGVQDVRRDRRLALLLALTALSNLFIMGPAVVGVPLFVRRVLGRGAEAYALVEAALGLGMLIGSLLVTRLAGRLGKGRTLLIGLAFDGATHAVVYFCRSYGLLLTLIAVHALGIPLIMVMRTVLVQEWVPRERRGRVFALVNVAVSGMTALSIALVGFLASVWPVQAVFGLFGLLALVCGLLGALYRPLRAA